MNTILNWLSINRRLIILFSFILALVWITVGFFMNNSLVYLDVETLDNKSAVVTFSSSDAENKKIGGSGLIIVPRKTKSLLVTSGEYVRTQAKINLPWYGFTQKKIQLKQDLNAEKIAYRSTTGAQCATYSPSKQKLLYYNCRNPKTITEYITPQDQTWTNRKVADLFYSNREAKPYSGGVIGIAHIDAGDTVSSGDIIFTNDSGKAISYIAPEEINMESISRAKIFTDTHNPENKKFVVVDVEGNIYLGVPGQGNNVQYRKIPAPDNYSLDYNQTLCAINDDIVYCYQGRTAAGDMPERVDFNKFTDFTVIKSSFTDSAISSTKVSDGLFSMNEIFISNGDLFGKRYKKLFELKQVDNHYTINELLQNVDSVSGGEELTVIQNSGVYKLDPATSNFHQIFYSPHISPKNIYNSSGKTFVIGTLDDEKTTTYAYQLNNTPNITPGSRLLDKLPVKPKSLSNVLFTDSVSDRLLITLNPTYRYIRDGQKSINEGELASLKMEVLQQLDSLEINIDEQNIQFTY